MWIQTLEGFQLELYILVTIGFSSPYGFKETNSTLKLSGGSINIYMVLVVLY